MIDSHNASLTKIEGDVEVETPLSEIWKSLGMKKQYWVDFRACQGLSFNEDGTPIRMTVAECADTIGVNRRTLYTWNYEIPRIVELTFMRRRKIYGDKVVGKAWQATALKAAKGDTAAVERILTNFDKTYRSPKQVHEFDVGGNLVGLFADMRKKAEVIDGEYRVPDEDSGELDVQQRPEDI